jgi:hypothetical protein
MVAAFGLALVHLLPSYGRALVAPLAGALLARRPLALHALLTGP